jgi:tetratricopeptide (TPR) repeat protein
MVNKVNEWKKKGPVGLNEVRDVRYACTNAIAERNWAKLADVCDEAAVRGFHDGKDRDFIHYYGAQAALELGDTTKALSEVSRALELSEGNTDYLDLRITIHLKRTENRKALADMGTRYGKAYGDINRQLIDLTKQIQSTPDDPSLYTLRGAFLHYKRNHDDAARDFKMAIQGGDSKARYFLALTLAADDKKEPAVEALRAFLAGHPESPGAEEARQFLAEITR